MDQTSAHTVSSLTTDLRALGINDGDTVLVHSSIRRVGFVAGGVQSVVRALLTAVGPDGTLVVPTHTPENSDPAAWRNPPVPEPWWPVIRDETPGFDPARTPSRWMGVLAENVRTWPGARRSGHPQVSVAAVGRRAEEIVEDHPLHDPHGERSPLGMIYRLDGKVLLLGCGYDSNTSLHLAETRQVNPPRSAEGASILDGDGSRWITWEQVTTEEEDFDHIGASFEAAGLATVGKVGEATAHLMAQRTLVDYATAWMATHR